MTSPQFKSQCRKLTIVLFFLFDDAYLIDLTIKSILAKC
jgi:hypothetical protein